MPLCYGGLFFAPFSFYDRCQQCDNDDDNNKNY